MKLPSSGNLCRVNHSDSTLLESNIKRQQKVRGGGKGLLLTWKRNLLLSQTLLAFFTRGLSWMGDRQLQIYLPPHSHLLCYWLFPDPWGFQMGFMASQICRPLSNSSMTTICVLDPLLVIPLAFSHVSLSILSQIYSFALTLNITMSSFAWA